jgi:redox-sensitive bicupin YhaK (pirin superfamily)
MIRIRRSDERGRADHGWLDTRHTFSFGGYYDPAYMGFRSLRVLNDDRVVPGAGFPTHPHRDMEIVSYVVEGALAHEDSLGTGSTIRPGDVQRMSAGTGVTHSEFNPSDTEGARFLQIWILPERQGLPPSYEQKHFPDEERTGRLCLVASPEGKEGSITIRQDASIFAALLKERESVRHEFAAGRHGWLQVVRGGVDLGAQRLEEGDGAAISGERSIEIAGRGDAEVLFFDLA